MIKRGQALYDWFLDKYELYDNLDYGEDQAIFDDDDVQNLLERADNFAQNRSGNYYRNNTPDILDKYAVPEWKKVADKNYNKAQEEIQNLSREYTEIKKNLTRELRQKIETVSDAKIREESERELRRVNPQSYGQLKTIRVLRLRRDFRNIFG